MKPTQEQTKEFWKWCGLHEVLASDGEYHWFKGEEIVSPTDDNHVPVVNLDNLFKWAVPKVTSMHGVGRRLQVKIVSSWGESDGEYGVEISNMGKRLSIFFDKNPALALFWTIWKVMKEEAK